MHSTIILGGDLGGTKTLLALAELRRGRPSILREERFDSCAYAQFDQVLAEFLKGTNQPIAAACFGLAGPTDGHAAQLTYLPWQLDGQAMEKRFGIHRVRLANDFAAAAHGLDLLAANQLVTLQAGRPLGQAPRVILGAGTGLGVAGLAWAGQHYMVVAGEGGHVGFSPQSPEQVRLWQYLFDRTGRVTIEDVASGPGLARVHAFLTGDERPPAEIGSAALAGGDPAARASVDLWLAVYGAFAGDLALQWLARGGVFIAGGIGSRLMPAISPRPFLEAFNAKRQHSAIAETMPVHLVTEERLGVLGALALAAAQAS